MQRNNLLLIYSRAFFRQAIMMLLFFVITLTTMLYIIFITESKALPSIAAILLVAGLGFYLSYLSQRSRLAFSLSRYHVQYHCSKGGWSLPWQSITQISIPTVSHEGWHQPLPWLGLRLANYEPLLNSISFRVASQLLIEQRGLLLCGYRYAEAPQLALEQMLFDETPYILSNGKVYRGLLAMLGNRMRYTRELLGYDVFIHESLLDRPLDDFAGVMRQYHAAADK